MRRKHRSTGWDEERLLAFVGSWERALPLAGSQGHDAAVLHGRGGRDVVCTDQVVLGVHAAEDTRPALVGAKAVARTVSDLAATAAEPLACLLAVRAPGECDERWLRALLVGARDRAEELGAPVVGGDLAAAPGPPSVACTAIGRLAGRRRPPGRDRARAGQVLLLTGPVGGSGLGRHLKVEPRLEAGRALWAAGATALMDVSDGLGLDASRLARASGVRLVLESVPVHPDAERAGRASGRPALLHALEDGEDHELLATLPAPAARRLLGSGLPGAPRARLVGRVEAGRPGLVLALGPGAPCPDGPWRGGGWVHGRRRG